MIRVGRLPKTRAPKLSSAQKHLSIRHLGGPWPGCHRLLQGFGKRPEAAAPITPPRSISGAHPSVSETRKKAVCHARVAWQRKATRKRSTPKVVPGAALPLQWLGQGRRIYLISKSKSKSISISISISITISITYIYIYMYMYMYIYMCVCVCVPIPCRPVRLSGC